MGGGGSKATTSTNLASSVAIDAIARNIMNCKNNTFLRQSFIVTGNYNVVKNTKMVQNLKLSTKCSQDTQNTINLQQEVTNAIHQIAEAQSVSVLGAIGNGSVSDAYINISNEVKQKITAETILNIINDTNAQQDIIIAGDHNIIDNFEMSQTLELLQENCQKVVNDLKSVQILDNTINQTANSKQTNFISDIIDSVFSGLADLMNVWVIFLIVMVVVVLGTIWYIGPSNIIQMLGPDD